MKCFLIINISKYFFTFNISIYNYKNITKKANLVKKYFENYILESKLNK